MRWSLLAAVAVAALALVCGPAPGGVAGPRVELVDGTLSLHDSLEGQAIFSAEDIGPGHSASGTVTLANAGTLPGDLTLAPSDLSDTPGPGGSPLSGQMQLVVQDLSAGTTVYSGPLSTMGALGLGTLGPGAAKLYGFTASLPPSADQSVAGASTSVSYTWTAEEAIAPPPPPPPPPPGGGDTSDLRQPLRMRVRVPSRQRLVPRGKLVAYVRCDHTCWIAGRARLAAGRGRPVRTALARSGRVPAGRKKKLTLRLPKAKVKAVLRSLRKSRRGSLSITVTGRTSEGAQSTVRKRARIAAAGTQRR